MPVNQWPLATTPRKVSGNNQSVGSSAPVASRWLGSGNRTFLEVASMVVTWWINLVVFLHSDCCLVCSSLNPFVSIR